MNFGLKRIDYFEPLSLLALILKNPYARVKINFYYNGGQMFQLSIMLGS